MWRNVRAAALNVTFQLLVIYRFSKGSNLFSITINSRLRNINSWVLGGAKSSRKINHFHNFFFIKKNREISLKEKREISLRQNPLDPLR